MKVPSNVNNLFLSAKKIHSVISEDAFSIEPKVSILVPFKFNLKDYFLDLDQEPNFFIFSQKAKSELYKAFGIYPKPWGFYFHNLTRKEGKVNFRKRKNIYFNMGYRVEIYKDYYSFIELLVLILFLSSSLNRRYFKKKKFIYFTFAKDVLVIYIKNLHWTLSFLRNTKFQTEQYLFKVTIDFRNSDKFFLIDLKDTLAKLYNLN